jgi:hypothetical protein
MATLSNEFSILFFLVAVGFFAWRFVRDKSMAAINSKGFAPRIKPVAIGVAGTIAMLFLASFLGVDTSSSRMFIAGGFILPFILTSLKMDSWLRALILLIGSVIATMAIPNSQPIALPAMALGLVLSSFIETFAIGDEERADRSFVDILPALIWLIGLFVMNKVDNATWYLTHQKLFLVSITSALVLRWLQGPFIKQDNLYVKRLTLAATGGLLLLILVTKMMVALDLSKLAIVGGAGFMMTYLLDSLDKKNSLNAPSSLKSFKALLFIGIFTLVVSRLFGTAGLIVLASTTIISVGYKHKYAAIAGFFWLAKAMLEAFVFTYNSNMTGINLMHVYVSAGLYAGFLMAVTIAYLVKNTATSGWVKALLISSAGLMAPMACNYFLHAEAASSFMLASVVASLMVSIFLVPNSLWESEGNELIMAFPLAVITCAQITGDLIEKGNACDANQRLTTLGVLAAISAVIVFVSTWRPGQGGPKVDATPAPPPPPTSESIV